MKPEFIVIGGGSAGCSLAHELVINGRTVLLLEAGGSDFSPFIKIPSLQPIAGKRFDWGYVSEPDASRGGASDKWTRGRVLGGSSSINGTIFVRGAPHDYDRWAAEVDPGANDSSWRYGNIKPLFEDMEHFDRALAGRGTRGNVSVRTVNDIHPLTQAFIDSARRTGVRWNEDYNGACQEGISRVQLSQRKGIRCSAAEAFIKPIRRNPNFHLGLNAQVESLVIEAGRVTGVRYRDKGGNRLVRAPYVIVAAGALNTPKILMLSGVGNPSELKSHGITIEVESPEVGANLREHPIVRVVLATKRASYNPPHGLVDRFRLAAKFLQHREGPIASPFEAVAFLRSSESAINPDLQFHVLPLGYRDISKFDPAIYRRPSFSVLINLSYPHSSGRVGLRGADPNLAPLIRPSLLSDRRDLGALVNGIQIARKIVSTSPFAELVQSELFPGPEFSSAESLRDFLPLNTELAYHPVGTCRMGADRRAVVDSSFKVNGLANLWVCDASVMPHLISGNTNAACMMLGMKLGRELANSSPPGT